MFISTSVLLGLYAYISTFKWVPPTCMSLATVFIICSEKRKEKNPGKKEAGGGEELLSAEWGRSLTSSVLCQLIY
jgi:hypothetical protein